VNDREATVVARNEIPVVRLAPGDYRISGRFEWDARPGTLRLPAGSGLVTLTVDGRQVARPDFGRDAVFLGERIKESRTVDSVRVVVHRLVADDIPTRLITQLQIDVSGSVREAEFGPVLPADFTPLSLRSPLPARLEADGKLRLQVRPGRWTVYIDARAPGVLNEIARGETGIDMPPVEIWSYQSNDRLRVTAAEGMPPVDPAQVDVPGNWQHFPAFRIDSGAAFTVTERSRGVVSASNELSLRRTMWLDFDDGGFVVRDGITGEMQTGWRLDMQAPYALLSATEEGENLLITLGDDAAETGVEVRQTHPNLETLGRIAARGSIPVTGWQTRFANVDTTLHLPPGHKLLAAPGVDNARSSWVGRWQLLDFFLLLIITIAVWRLFNPAAGVIALLALMLSFHELSAPTWLWLNALLAIALLRVAPAGRLRQAVTGYQWLSAVALVMVLVPFIAGQLRIALYPQLEPQYNQYELYDYSGPMPAAAPESAEIRLQKDMADSQPMRVEGGIVSEEVVVTASKVANRFARFAPNAIVQAGPGIPSWRWNTYRLNWSGPVDAEQDMRLVILPRWLVSVLRVVQVGLLLLLAAVLAAEILGKRWVLPGGLKLGRGQAASILMAGLLVGLAALPQDARAQVPDADLLRQLEQRLTEPPDCVPRCAEIVAADITVAGNAIAMSLTINALEDVAIPLPGSADGWRPDAISVEGATGARVVRAADNALWIHVTAGRHTLLLRGAAPDVDSLEVPFGTPPRVVSVETEGWQVAGVKDRRLLSGSLQLTRTRTGDGDDTVRWESSRFPTFARVERSVDLDLDWRVHTTVYRVAPLEGALTLEIPLLDGEQIVSGDFEVDDGMVLVSMNPQQGAVSWTSNLPRQSPLVLTAPEGAAWKEQWRFAVGNVWNASFAGVPESESNAEANDVRVAVFDPRGGEQLTLTASRPEPAPGDTLAFDAVGLVATHGDRASDVSLSLSYRSTRGAQHALQLPDGAEVTLVEIDGRAQTLRDNDGVLTLPILPGAHNVLVNWRAADELGLLTRTPVVDIGAPASNITLSLSLPRDRWLLGTRGPLLGPAVMYWPELAALILFALILGRTNLAPLRSRHWLLLGLGFSTFSWGVLGIVVFWLLACGARARWQPQLSWWRFNLVQVAIGGITIIALLALLTALPQGLLGTPDMHVVGQDSFGNNLNWFADRSAAMLPVATALTVPLWIYKALILAWALWLSFALLRWLPWVWQCFSSQGYWRSRRDDQQQQD